MKKLDPRLRQLARQDPFAALPMMEALGISAQTRADSDQLVSVEALIRCRDSTVIDNLRHAGVDVRFVSKAVYTTVSAVIPSELLSDLSEMEGVERIEASREMITELDVSGQECRVDRVHAGNPSVRGTGALVGIIDAGIDYTHPDFRNADGTSRILYLWDQSVPGPSNSPAVPDGREYTKKDLDSALSSGKLIHRDKYAHGTHVAGIAAGNGAGDPSFAGIAPEAGLIVVALVTEKDTSLGRSMRAFEAFNYVVRRANSLGLPVAINLSQGMNGGGHSGETLVETGLSDLARKPGVVIVKSAGNEQEWRTHAGGQIAAGQTIVVEIVVGDNHVDGDVLEVWTDGEDAISVALQPPGSIPLAFVAAGDRGEFETLASNNVVVESDTDADDTGDTLATIFISKGNVPFVQPGTWKLLLRGDTIQTGRYDVWIEITKRRYAGEQTRFTTASADDTRTLTIPGTGQQIITVGSYVSRVTPGFSAQLGQCSTFSSCGPTRYGIRKPDISAPGDIIVSSRSSQSSAQENPSTLYTPMAGTSMAAPHVTGAAALILSLRPTLNSDQVRQILSGTARRDGFATSAPDNRWGSGKLDIEAAIARAQTARFPEITGVVVTGNVLSWTTDIPTSSAVRFHTHQGQLQLGKSLGSRTDLTLRTDHVMALDSLDDGDYYCEVLAYGRDGLLTVDDGGGPFYVVQIP